jgi:hypothetical protein
MRCCRAGVIVQVRSRLCCDMDCSQTHRLGILPKVDLRRAPSTGKSVEAPSKNLLENVGGLQEPFDAAGLPPPKP